MLPSLETEDDLAVLSLENLYNPKINPEDPDLFAAKGHSSQTAFSLSKLALNFLFQPRVKRAVIVLTKAF